MASQRETLSRRGRYGWLVAEFVVVVLGVAVGLAVDQWRDGRDDVELQVGYLERLRADLQSDVTEFEVISSVMAERSRRVMAFLEVVDGRAPAPASHYELLADLGGSMAIDLIVSRRDTYDELISQGDLALVQSAELRDSLAEYHLVLDGLTNGQFAEWAETGTRMEYVLIESLPATAYRWIQGIQTASAEPDFSLADREVSTGEASAVLAAVRSDTEVRNLLYRIGIVQRRLSIIAAEYGLRAASILAIVDSELERLRGS